MEERELQQRVAELVAAQVRALDRSRREPWLARLAVLGAAIAAGVAVPLLVHAYPDASPDFIPKQKIVADEINDRFKYVVAGITALEGRVAPLEADLAKRLLEQAPVIARYTFADNPPATNQALPQLVDVHLNFATKDIDNYNAVANPDSDWAFVAPTDAFFAISVNYYTSGSGDASIASYYLDLYKNGQPVPFGGNYDQRSYSANYSASLTYSDVIRLSKDDRLYVKARTSRLNDSARGGYFAIHELR